MTTDSELLRVINGSGFPLQIAVQHVVEQGTTAWRVVHKEHAWQNGNDGQNGFIDLVLQSNETYDCLVVECKRVMESAWLFLSHNGQTALRTHCKAWVTAFKAQERYPNPFGWVDIQLPLGTPEAQFCCLRGQLANNKNTFLERIAGEMVSATEALAMEEREVRAGPQGSCRLYFNVLVTTAQLYFAAFEQSHLKLDEGSLSEATFKRVPYLRVRKQFSLRPYGLGPSDWRREDEVDYRRENTILVVEAAHLLDFLNEFRVGDINTSHILA